MPLSVLDQESKKKTKCGLRRLASLWCYGVLCTVVVGGGGAYGKERHQRNHTLSVLTENEKYVEVQAIVCLFYRLLESF